MLEETHEMHRLTYFLGREVPLAGASQVSAFAGDSQRDRVLFDQELRNDSSTIATARKMRSFLESDHSATNEGSPRIVEHARAARTWPDVEQEIIEKIDEFGDVA